MILRLLELVGRNPQALPREELEIIQRFLVYVSRTYVHFKPYLKGLHLSIESWKEFRDREGGKLQGKKLKEAQE